MISSERVRKLQLVGDVLSYEIASAEAEGMTDPAKSVGYLRRADRLRLRLKLVEEELNANGEQWPKSDESEQDRIILKYKNEAEVVVKQQPRERKLVRVYRELNPVEIDRGMEPYMDIYEDSVMADNIRSVSYYPPRS